MYSKDLDYYSAVAEMYPGHSDLKKPDTSSHALLVRVASCTIF